jgi:hypothetical protein
MFVAFVLSGLVEPDFQHDHGAADYFQQLKEEVNKHKSDIAQRYVKCEQSNLELIVQIFILFFFQRSSFSSCRISSMVSKCVFIVDYISVGNLNTKAVINWGS